MPWITLTRDDLKTRFSKPELQKLPSAARAEGLTAEAVLDEAVAGVVGEVRGYVAVKNALGPAGSIPEELKNAALSRIVPLVIGRLPGLTDLMDETRKTGAQDALSLLRRVAEGNFAIVPPAVPAADDLQAGSPMPSIKPREKNFRLEDQDGL